MGKSSSAKKVARLAQRGKGKKVRFQGGTIFPLVVVGVIVAGLALIAYGRATVPGFDSEAAIDSQADVAFDFFLCDEWVTLDEPTDPVVAFDDFGVIGLDAGLARVQALQADGNRGARLGSLMDAYGVELSDSRLRLPEGVADKVQFDRNTDRCGGSNATLSVVSWNDAEGAGPGQVSIAALRDVRLTNNPMLVAIAFASSGTTVPPPPSRDALAASLLPTPAGPDPVTDPVTDPGAEPDQPEDDESGTG